MHMEQERKQVLKSYETRKRTGFGMHFYNYIETEHDISYFFPHFVRLYTVK